MTPERLKEIKEWFADGASSRSQDFAIELIAAVEQQSWISVKERLPEKDNEMDDEDSESVRVLLSDADGNRVAGYYDFYHKAWFQSLSCERVENVTHWIPLPLTPGTTK